MHQVRQPAVADAFNPGPKLSALFYRREVYRHISNMSQRELERMYRLRIWAHLAIFIAAMGGLGRNLIA